MDANEKTNTNTKKRRRKRNLKLRAGIIIAVLVLVGVLIGVLNAPKLKLEEIGCEGTVVLKADDIIAKSGLSKGTNILLSNVGRAKQNIEKEPMVKSCSVNRVFPNKILIKVEERTAAAYISNENGCVLTDIDGYVLKKYDGDEAQRIKDSKMPNFKVEEASEDKTENIDKSTEGAQENDEEVEDDGYEIARDENGEIIYDEDGDMVYRKKGEDIEAEKSEDKQEEQKEEQANSQNQENQETVFSVPYIEGIKIKSADEGKEIQFDNENKQKKLMELFGAFNEAGLLSRLTYVNMDNLSDLHIVLENRLDILFGRAENMSYRAKFLAEVINTKISVFESCIMDYTGDDIYVRPMDDGKERVKELKDDKKDAKETSDKDSEKKKSDNEEDE